jgi:hypothetical protein
MAKRKPYNKRTSNFFIDNSPQDFSIENYGWQNVLRFFPIMVRLKANGDHSCLVDLATVAFRLQVSVRIAEVLEAGDFRLEVSDASFPLSGRASHCLPAIDLPGSFDRGRDDSLFFFHFTLPVLVQSAQPPGGQDGEQDGDAQADQQSAHKGQERVTPFHKRVLSETLVLVRLPLVELGANHQDDSSGNNKADDGDCEYAEQNVHFDLLIKLT